MRLPCIRAPFVPFVDKNHSPLERISDVMVFA